MSYVAKVVGIVGVTFVVSLVLDLFSTIVVIKNTAGLKELSPVIADPNETRVSVFLATDAKMLVIVSCILVILLIGLTSKHSAFRRFSSRGIETVFLVAVAKFWFTFENISLLAFGTNAAQTLQMIIEELSLYDINSRTKAMVLALLIAVPLSMFITKIFFRKFPLYSS